MRCPNCLYNNHEQAEVCENCGESLLGEDRLFRTCPHCGYINEKEAEFCEACDEPLSGTGRRKSIQKKMAKKKRQKNRAKLNANEGRFPWVFMMILIFIALILLGLFPQADALAPSEWTAPATLILLRGTNGHGLAENSNLSTFGALAMDSVGLIQMSTYVDGALVDAQTYAGATQAHYQPALSSLPAGEHEVFIRATNAEGQASVSQIIAIEAGRSQGGALNAVASGDFPTAPQDVRANLIDDGRRISISWEPADAPVASVRVYVRPPGSASLVHLEDLSGEAAQFDFKPDRPGEWETYVAYVSDAGWEGPLAYARQVVGEPDTDGFTGSEQPLPAPTHVQLATTTAQCQSVASRLGPVRDSLYNACTQQLGDTPTASFMTWRWPLTWQEGQLLSTMDLNGFEVKLVLTDQNGQALGERISAIPFNEARGALRMAPDLDYGLQASWSIRAVGQGMVSDWAYAGSTPAASCDQASPVENGCLGQSDGVAYSDLPEGVKPDLLFGSACDLADQCYTESEFGQSRAYCDNAFLEDMLNICNENADTVDLATCQALAQDFYRSANLTGAHYFQGENLTDCLDANGRLGCFWGNLPDVVQNAANRVWGGAVWSGRAAWTGVMKLGQGGAWVIDWMVNAVN